MRTATFGDRQVIRTLQRDFILLWHNQSPGLNEKGEQAEPTDEQVKAYPEGAGGSNVMTYIAEPGGTVVYQLTGFWRPERFLSELKFGRDLVGRGRIEKPEKRSAALAAELTARVKAVGDERAALVDKHPAEFKKPVRESEVRKKDAALGLLQNSIEQSMTVAGGTTLGTFFKVRTHKGILK